MFRAPKDFLWPVGILGFLALLAQTAGYAGAEERFTLLCSPSIVKEAGEMEREKNERFCNKIARIFQGEFGRDFGVSVEMEFVFGKEGFQRIIVQSEGSAQPVDVWVGGAPYFHELGREKDLLSETQEIMRPEWSETPISVSITSKTRHYKLAFIFIDWFQGVQFDVE